MTNLLQGGCLCGAVRYRAEAEPMMIGNCYCVDCRKSSATSHSTHVCVPEQDYDLTGDVKFYDRAADSGNIISRGFCPNCASPILSRNGAMPGTVFIRASSLDDPSVISPQMSVYTSRAPSWAQIDHSKPVFAEMPSEGP